MEDLETWSLLLRQFMISHSSCLRFNDWVTHLRSRVWVRRAPKINYLGNESELGMSQHFWREFLFIKLRIASWAMFNVQRMLIISEIKFSCAVFWREWTWNGGKSRFSVMHFLATIKKCSNLPTRSFFPYGWMVLDLIWVELHSGMYADPLILDWASRRRGSLTMTWFARPSDLTRQLAAIRHQCLEFWPP